MELYNILFVIGVLSFVVTARNLINSSNSNIIRNIFNITETIQGVKFIGFIVIAVIVFVLASASSKHGGSIKFFNL